MANLALVLRDSTPIIGSVNGKPKKPSTIASENVGGEL